MNEQNPPPNDPTQPAAGGPTDGPAPLDWSQAGFPVSGGFDAPPLPPPPAHSEVRDAVFIDDGERFIKTPSIIGRLGVVAAALAIAGGGAFAVTRALGEPAGPQTPLAAVEQFFVALDNDDLIGVAETMLPSERESLIDPSLDLLIELQRLEIIDPAMDPGAITSVDLQVDGLEAATAEIGPGVARANLTAGVVSVSGSTADVPWGSLLADRAAELVPVESYDEEIVDFADEEVELAIVEEDGSWYVSLWYSVAEAARQELDAPLPAFGNGVQPVGGSTPEAAFENMINAAVALDAEAAIANLDPREFRALYDYAPLFLGQADDGAEELRQMMDDNQVSVRIDRLDLTSGELRGRTVVSMNGFAAVATMGDEAVSIDYDGRCLNVVIDGEIEALCENDLADQFAGAGLPAGFDRFYSTSSSATAVERDGRWYVSGLPTVLYGYRDLLAELERADLEEMINGFESLFESGLGFGGASPFGDSFFELGAPGGMTSAEDEFNAIADEFDTGELDTGELDSGSFDNGSTDNGSIDDGSSDDAFDQGGDVEEIDVTETDRALFLPELDLIGNSPDWYFGFNTSLEPLSYTTGWSEAFQTIEIARFPEGSHDTLIADLEADRYYLPVTMSGLPEGLVAYQFADVDIVVVHGDLVISTWLDNDLELFMSQLRHLAGS